VGENIEDSLIASHVNGTANSLSDLSGLALDDALYNFEKNMIVDAMRKADGVKNKAAKILGINTSALYYKLEKFGLL
jgi:DNA-binding NtrC family response regulator